MRHLSSDLDINVSQPADIVLSIAVSSSYAPREESLTMTLDGQPVDFHEVTAPGEGRLHRVRPGAGELKVSYRATVAEPSTKVPLHEADEILYGRPSRYCDSDRLLHVAGGHFRGLQGRELVDAVREWVATNIVYVPGSSRVVDGALDTYLSRRGVCRDSAHLVVTFLRARGLPARLVSVYAPGLQPMDFHAVAEVLLDGVWYVLDATGLAPRETMVRIMTGRDASDTAFMTTLSGRTQLRRLAVNATAEGTLPVEDPGKLVVVG